MFSNGSTASSRRGLGHLDLRGGLLRRWFAQCGPPPRRSHRQQRNRGDDHDRRSAGAARRGRPRGRRRRFRSRSQVLEREHEIARRLESAFRRLLQAAPDHAVERLRHVAAQVGEIRRMLLEHRVERFDPAGRSRRRVARRASRTARTRTKRCRSACRRAHRGPVPATCSLPSRAPGRLRFCAGRVASSPSSPAGSVASPKSRSFTCPSRVTKMFSGFRSR